MSRVRLGGVVRGRQLLAATARTDTPVAVRRLYQILIVAGVLALANAVSMVESSTQALGAASDVQATFADLAPAPVWSACFDATGLGMVCPTDDPNAVVADPATSCFEVELGWYCGDEWSQYVRERTITMDGLVVLGNILLVASIASLVLLAYLPIRYALLVRSVHRGAPVANQVKATATLAIAGQLIPAAFFAIAFWTAEVLATPHGISLGAVNALAGAAILWLLRQATVAEHLCATGWEKATA